VGKIACYGGRDYINTDGDFAHAVTLFFDKGSGGSTAWATYAMRCHASAGCPPLSAYCR